MLLSFALQASELVPLSQFVQWLPLGLRTAAVIPCFLIAEPQRLSVYVVLQFLASLAGMLVGLAITSKHVHLEWRPRPATKHELKDGASYAAMHLVTANPSELDKIIAVRMIGAHDAGIYTASSRVMSAAVTPVIAMLLASQPRLFRHAHSPGTEGHRLIALIAVLAGGWGLVSGLLLMLGSPLLPWLFGLSYKGSAQALPLLSIAAPFLSMRLAAGTVLVALGRPLERLAFEFGGIVLLLAGILTLTPWLGLRGLIVAVIAAEALMSAVGWWLVRQRLRQSSVRTNSA
jgi:O-antigen/teichoic acid export membrane protein